MQSASADFPIDGRAATMIRLPGWNPDVSRSRSRKPDGVPVMSLPASYSLVIVSNESFSSVVDVLELGRDALLREVEHDLLGAVDELDGLARTVQAEPRDVVARPDEAAQRRHLRDDAARSARAFEAAGTSAASSWMRSAPPADVERRRLLELVDDRDRVDRLALCVEARIAR